MKYNRNYSNKRMDFILCIMFVGFIACILRLAWLQLIEGDELSAKAMASQNMLRNIQSPRGTIYDTSGKELAVSLVSLSLYVDPVAMDDSRAYERKNPPRDPRKAAATLLAKMLKQNEDELYEIFSRNNRFVWLERTMDKKKSDKIKLILKENNLNGFGFIKESKRYYPLGKLAAQILGFVGTDDEGLRGLERKLDSFLKSAAQKQQIQSDIAGRPIFSSVFQENQPKEMTSVYLTIDNRIQFATEKALDKAMETSGAKSATAIVMSIDTGEIVAMATTPSFEPNFFYNYNEQTWLNKAISMIYEPGSTFKPIIASIAMEEGLINPENMVYDYGEIKVSGRTIKNSDRRANGSIPFSDVIKKSINTSMVELGLKIGPKTMNEYAKKFGLGVKTGIDLPGEENGILFQPEKMRPIDVASMSIGQGIAVTPIQLICAISTIANNGTPVKPHIIKKIVQEDGSIVQKKEIDEIKPQIISTETSRKMISMLESVITDGGGKLAQIPGYRVAGKTGTAEKIKPTGGYAKGEYIVSFVGVAPVEKPKFAVLVIVDTPRKGVLYGGFVAAPVFKEIMQQTLTVNGIEPSSPDYFPTKKINIEKNNSKTNNVNITVPIDHTATPDLKGLSMRECASILGRNELSFYPIGSGKAIKQEPPPFKAVPKNSEVKVWFQ